MSLSRPANGMEWVVAAPTGTDSAADVWEAPARGKGTRAPSRYTVRAKVRPPHLRSAPIISRYGQVDILRQSDTQPAERTQQKRAGL